MQVLERNMILSTPETSLDKSSKLIKSNNTSFFSFLIDEMGGIYAIITIIVQLLSNIINVKWMPDIIKKIIKFILLVGPFYIFFYKFKCLYEKYNNIQNNKNIQDVQQENIDKILGYSSNREELGLGKYILNWLFTFPICQDFQIKSFYDLDFKKINLNEFQNNNCGYILLYYNEFQVDVVLEIPKSTLTKYNYIHMSYEFIDRKKIKDILIKNFLKTLNYDKNIIYYNVYKDIELRPKIDLKFEIDQFDVNGFCKQIQSAIDHNIKRGYVFCGPAGTGKSSIITSIENKINTLPFIYIDSSSWKYEEDILEVFKFIRLASPCIVVFEDIDSYGFAHKSSIGTFINEIDSLKINYNVIFIATCNYTNLIESSLIDRRGRIDEVYYINYPQSSKEILSVLKNHYYKRTSKKLKINFITDEFLKKIIELQLTHSDICEIIDKIILTNEKINLKNLLQSVHLIMKTKESIEKAKQFTPVLD
jgi:hypothetical protein